MRQYSVVVNYIRVAWLCDALPLEKDPRNRWTAKEALGDKRGSRVFQGGGGSGEAKVLERWKGRFLLTWPEVRNDRGGKKREVVIGAERKRRT